MEQRIVRYFLDNQLPVREVRVHAMNLHECMAVLDRRVVMVFGLGTIDVMDTDGSHEDNIIITEAYCVSPEYSEEIAEIVDIKTEYENDVIQKCIAVVLSDNTMEVVLTRERGMVIYRINDECRPKARIVAILQQPTAVLHRFVHNYIYLWVFCEDKVLLVNVRLAAKSTEICQLFYIDISNIEGKFHPRVYELLSSSNGEGTFLALYFDFGSEIRVYAIDTRNVLWHAEKNRILTGATLVNHKEPVARGPTETVALSRIDAGKMITPLVVPTRGGRIDSIHIDPKSICAYAYARGTYRDDFRFPYSFQVVASIGGNTITQAIVSEQQYLIDSLVTKGVECLDNPNIKLDDPGDSIQLGVNRAVDGQAKSIITNLKDGKASISTCNHACAASTLWFRPLNEDVLRGKKYPRNLFVLETLLATGHGNVIADYINHKNSFISSTDYALTDYARVYNWAVGDDVEFSYKAYLCNELSRFNKDVVLSFLLDKDVFGPPSAHKLQSRNVPISTTMLLQQIYNICNGLGVIMSGFIMRQLDSFNGEPDMKRLYMLGLEKNLMEIQSLQRLVHLLSIITQDRCLTLAMVGTKGEGPIYKVFAQLLKESLSCSAALDVNMLYSQLTGDTEMKTGALNKFFFLSHSIVTSASSITSDAHMSTIKRLQDYSDGLVLYFIAHMYYESICRPGADNLSQKLDAFYHHTTDCIGVNKSTSCLMLSLFKIDRNIDVAAAIQCLCDVEMDCHNIMYEERMFKAVAATLLHNNCHHELYLHLNTCKSHYLRSSINWQIFLEYYCDSLSKSTTWVSGLQIARRFCSSLHCDIAIDAKKIVIKRFFKYARSIKSLSHFLTQVALDEVEIVAIYNNFDELIKADCAKNNFKTSLIDVAFYWLLQLNRVDLAWRLHNEFSAEVDKQSIKDFDTINFRNARVSAYKEYNMHPYFM